MHCDKHVVKMILEYAQLLSTAHRVIDGEERVELSKNGRKIKRYYLNDDREQVLYKACHVNHPSAVWVRESTVNYWYLFRMFHELCDEYTYRYRKVHKSASLLETLWLIPNNMKGLQFTVPPCAMKQYPDCIVPGDTFDNVIESYQNYYRIAKRGFAKWTSRETPAFMKTEGITQCSVNAST